MDAVPRPQYLRELEAFRGKRLIKMITGVRGCGKSTLLRLFRRHLLDLGVEEDQIVTVSFEEHDALELRDPKRLHDALTARIVPGSTTYFVLPPRRD
ncbi:AAA family ATPase [Sutterella sp.]|uniref:AAA family ATPase n=1 Tax=Sutterella sp. TaxID=1981025 RepID=UPI0026DF1BF8|nr:AAA family ATPase [Sutterella sp.]MDO5532672.1 AAA family ATPase [Sutterella sp.]